MKIFSFTKFAIFTLFFLFIAVSLSAQDRSKLDIAIKYMEEQAPKWGLTKQDVSEFKLSSEYQSKHNGVTHIYLNQSKNNIEVFNAIINLNIAQNDKVIFAGNRFVQDLAAKVNTSTAQINESQAIQSAISHLGMSSVTPLKLLRSESGKKIFDGGLISKRDIPVKLMYYVTKEKKARLAWNLEIEQVGTSDYWNIFVDASTSEVLYKNNYTLYCNFTKDPNHAHHESCGLTNQFNSNTIENNNITKIPAVTNQSMMNSSAGTYNVFPLPLESPIQGNRQILTDPFDVVASPYGWHDTNGAAGAEYQITRGNNVHSYLDVNGDDATDGGEPNGTSTLDFDFPYDNNNEPAVQSAAATVNLFYMNNMLHDITYNYGFDEVAGNFQKNNYGHGSAGNDNVLAEAQDGSGTDNANFSTPPDGSNGRMQMFLWGRGGGKLVRVNAPSEVAGFYDASTSSFGPVITTTGVTGELVVADDGFELHSDACSDFVNSAEINGKICIIDRGGCYFDEKVLRAQQAGAIAVIVCNYEDAVIVMGEHDGTVTSQITIPSVMMKKGDCTLFKSLINNGLNVSLIVPPVSGPNNLDGDFDNGIIAHEFGHGISNRLTGGPNNTSCLSNDEQMGEGWSDFFTLITTAKPGDQGTDGRGIGTFVMRQSTDGLGIRRAKYSTDPNINKQVYDDIIGTTAPHPLGEVWTDCLWDLYWEMVEVYGFDPDLIHGTGGNNKAIQLVMDGMKFQACNPGFIDGRDAILAADEINNNGENQCLIWKAFAKRGLGFSANQGSNDNRNDGTQAFDLLPSCVRELVIKKTTDNTLINAGDQITYKIKLYNFKGEAVTNVAVTENVPTNAIYVTGSASNGGNLVGSQVKWNINSINPGDSLTLTYKINTSPALTSTCSYFDNFETDNSEWFIDVLDGQGLWLLTDTKAYSGDYSYYITGEGVDSDNILVSKALTITGSNPVLRFNHFYNTEPGNDGGLLQISTDNGTTWTELGDKMFKNPYRGNLAYTTFTIPFLQAFWGTSNGAWKDTYIDLKDYAGQTVKFRFRFGTDAQVTSEGWYIDDFLLMDMVNYDSEVCATTQQGDQVCASNPNRGAIVDATCAANNNNEIANDLNIHIFPNPANDNLQVQVNSNDVNVEQVRVLSIDGKQMLLFSDIKNKYISLPVNSLVNGVYILEVLTDKGIKSFKFNKLN